MLRFIKHHLTGIDGVQIYPIISLLIFVLFFIAVITYATKMKRKDIDELSQIPFESDKEDLQEAVVISKK